MNFNDSDLLPSVSDLGGAVIEVLPVEEVGDALAELPFPDLDAATETVVMVGKAGSRRVVRVVRTAGRHPFRTALALALALGLVAGVAAAMRQRRDDQPQLSVAA